jgi:hypothetical protein
VDALAVMRLAETALIESGKQHRVAGDPAHGNMATRAGLEMAEARAAVAELVEAAREYERGTRPGSNPGWTEELRPALVAALSKFGA